MNEDKLHQALSDLVLDFNKLKNMNKTLKYTNKKLRKENKTLQDIIEANPFMSYKKPEGNNEYLKLT